MKRTIIPTAFRSLCLLLAGIMLFLMQPHGYAEAQKGALGMLVSAHNRAVAAAVKSGGKTLVYTTSTSGENVGTTAVFSIDGTNEIEVVLTENIAQGTIQRWESAKSHNIPLYETAKPSADLRLSALYPARNNTGDLVRRQTPVQLCSIYADSTGSDSALLEFYRIDSSGARQPLFDKAASLGLLLDGSGNAVGIIIGREVAWCDWASSAKEASDSGISQSDSSILSSAVKDHLSCRTLQNPYLNHVSYIVNSVISHFAEGTPGIDTCNVSTNIIYRLSELRALQNGVLIADAAAYSSSGSFMKGAGAGIDSDDYWYLTYTFGPTATQETILYNTIAMVYGSVYSYDPALLGSDSGDHGNNAVQIAAALIKHADTGIGLSLGDLVFFARASSGSTIIGVDSAPLFENYGSSIVPKTISFD